MLLNFSILKKVIAGSICLYCFLVMEFGSNGGKKSHAFVMYFNNFVKATRFLILPNLDRCLAANAPTVVTLVISSSGNFKKRQTIRETWASPKNSKAVKDRRAVVYFIVSRPNSKEHKQKLQTEVAYHDDLIILDLEESYDNLVLKVYASMVFSTRFCPTASFHMKIDDDVVIHFDRMFHFLADSTSTRDALMCKIWTKARPDRRPDNKWYVSKDDWPAERFPRYCNGPMYLLGIPAARKILNAVPTLDLLKLEDVFFTGIAAKAANIQHLFWCKHIRHRNEELWWGESECDKDKEPLLFSVHSFNNSDAIQRGFASMTSLRCAAKKRIEAKRIEGLRVKNSTDDNESLYLD